MCIRDRIVKSASQGTSAGCGVRVLSGERTGYAYTDNLSPERLLHAARTAALIASGPAKETVQGFVETPTADLYPVPMGGFSLDLAARLELILRADRAARAYDPRIVQVRSSYSEELRRILIAASDGAFASDTQPLCRLNVFVIAKEDVYKRQSLELPAIIISGAAGFRLGYGMLFPGGLRWKDSVARGGIEAARLVSGIIPMLVIAGCLEGFFSPSNAPVWLKFTVGGLLFTLLNVWLFRPVKARAEAG